MSVVNAWDNLQVIRFDQKATVYPDKPTSLAPWRIWLVGAYHPCADAGEFLDKIHQAKGPVLLLLHRTDLESCLNEGVLDGWLDADPVGGTERPQRQVLVYWNAWGYRDYTSEIIPRLPARHTPRRLYTFWSDHLASDARPAAWLGHAWNLGLSLVSVAQPFADWREPAALSLSSVLSGVNFALGSPEAVFLEKMVEDVLRHDLLRHVLHAEGIRCRRDHTGRLQAVLDRGDTLWLLQGVAASLGWKRSDALLRGVLAALTDHLFPFEDGRSWPRRPIDLDDNARDKWQGAIDEINRHIETAKRSKP